MAFDKKHIRLDYAPLNISCTLVVTTPTSPATQIFDGVSGEWLPDRGLTPLGIAPVLTVGASDGSVASGTYTNASLANVKWYVDGEDIDTLSDWAGLYEFITDGDERGGILIYRNINAGECVALHMEAEILDTRTGTIHGIVTQAVLLTTLDMGDTGYALSLGDTAAIMYDPTRDALFEYEYGVAHGYEDEDATKKAAAMNVHAYRRTIPLSLFKGKEAYDGDWEVKLYSFTVSAGTVNLTEITDTDDSEFESIGTDGLTINLLMVERGYYMVGAVVDGLEVARVQFAVGRRRRPYQIVTRNGADRQVSDTTRDDEAVVWVRSRILTYPESIISMVWKTDTEKYTGVVQGEGRSVSYSIASTGCGSTVDDGWIDQYIEADYKGIHAVATDEDGNTYTDENGNTYIFN